MKALRADPDNIKTIFFDTYIIPEYQRPYTWGIDHCEQLWSDIENFHSEIDNENRSDTYFLGCITIYQDDDNPKDWFVTDGQQRLITLSLLIKAVYETSKQNEGLLACLCQDNVNTRKIDSEKPRIVSKVLEENNENLHKIIINGKADNRTQLGKNYTRLQELVGEWHDKNSNNPKSVDDLVTTLLTNVEILRIKSDSEDDALQIFETINDRGTPLNATDIFKVQLCRNSKDKQADFITQWKKLEAPWFLFSMYMYIVKANEDNRDSTMYKLKKYFKNRSELFNDPNKIMEDVAKIQDIKNGNWNMPSEIKQWWNVIEKYPNLWWQYPLYIFLFNKMKARTDEGIWDVSDITEEFQNLIMATTRYLVIKGINYRSVNRIKSTILNVCADIATGKEDYLSTYDKDIQHGNDKEEFKRAIEYHDNFGGYQKILVYLNSCLYENESDKGGSFHTNMHERTIQIEHILPRDWNHYDDWDTETHKSNVHKLGNLMPLTRKVNIKASNNFFSRKKDVYKDTDFAEAKELAESDIINWGPADLQERDEQVKARIFKFLEIEK